MINCWVIPYRPNSFLREVRRAEPVLLRQASKRVSEAEARQMGAKWHSPNTLTLLILASPSRTTLTLVSRTKAAEPCFIAKVLPTAYWNVVVIIHANYTGSRTVFNLI